MTFEEFEQEPSANTERALTKVATRDNEEESVVETVRDYPEEARDERPRFRLDRDRILYSSSFRKLQYKTQVFVTHEGDLYRTRMTHTLEVSQIARSLSVRLGLNEMLTEAIALAHDIGHAPFGHTGEETLKDLMKNCGGFEHNLQGLRVVEEIECVYPDFYGLNLCWETREGLARHVTGHDQPNPPEPFRSFNQPSLECQVVNTADAIAWSTHDLDDAWRINLIGIEEIKHMSRNAPVLELILEVCKGAKSKANIVHVESKVEDIGRSRAISSMIRELIMDVVSETWKRFEISGAHTQLDARQYNEYIVDFSRPIRDQVDYIKREMIENVYSHHRVHRMRFKGKEIIRDLFDAIRRDEKLLPTGTRERMKKSQANGTGEPKDLFICDYVSGMTDRYAMNLHDMLFQPNVRTGDWF